MSKTLTGMADVNTGLKFLDKTTVVPYNSTKSPLRGHVEVGRRERELMSSRRVDAPTAGGTRRRRHRRGAGGGASGVGSTVRRLLTLREGSIVVVTLLAIVYFSVVNDRFFTTANLNTLLPYFAPFAILAVGEVMLMVAGEIDLSIGSVYLFAPFMFYEFNQAGLPLLGGLLLSLVLRRAGGALNGFLTVVIGSPRSSSRWARCSASAA